MFKKIENIFASCIDKLKVFRERSQTLVWILLIASGLGHYAGCSMLNKCNQELNDISVVHKHTSDSLHTFRAKDGQAVAQKTASDIQLASLQQMLKDKDAAIAGYQQKLADANVKSKNVESIVTSTTTTGYIASNKNPKAKDIVVKLDSIPNTDTGAIRKLHMPTMYSFNDSGSFYVIEGTISGNHSMSFSKLYFPDSIFCVTAEQKKWFLGRSTFVVSIQHSNPYVQTNTLDDISIKPGRSIFQHPLFYAGAGAVAIEIVRIFVFKKP